MYSILLQTHSILRYLILAVLLIVLFRSAIGHLAKRKYEPFDNQASLLLLMLVHIQFVIGIVLYFVSPVVQAALADMGAAMKDDALRFAAVEHITVMLLAVIAITVGRVWSKKAKPDDMKHRRMLIGSALGFVLIIAGIPWEKMF